MHFYSLSISAAPQHHPDHATDRRQAVLQRSLSCGFQSWGHGLVSSMSLRALTRDIGIVASNFYLSGIDPAYTLETPLDGSQRIQLRLTAALRRMGGVSIHRHGVLFFESVESCMP